MRTAAVGVAIGIIGVLIYLWWGRPRGVHYDSVDDIPWLTP